MIEQQEIQGVVVSEFFHDAALQLAQALDEVVGRTVVLKLDSSLLSNSGMMRCASTLPSSTPHWSKESMFQITPCVKTLCS